MFRKTSGRRSPQGIAAAVLSGTITPDCPHSRGLPAKLSPQHGQGGERDRELYHHPGGCAGGHSPPGWASRSPRTVAAQDTHAIDPQELDERVFGKLDYQQVTERYFHYLCRITSGNLPQVARAAGIGRATAYQWAARFRGGELPASDLLQ